MRDLDEIECFVKPVELKIVTAAAKARKNGSCRAGLVSRLWLSVYRAFEDALDTLGVDFAGLVV